MADTVVSSGPEDNYGFSLEWIAEGTGIEEEICGVGKDCIVVPASPIIPKIENCDSDYVEIQVTEEEVIAGQWDETTDGVSELEVSSLAQDVLVPLDEEQDEYSRLHPYPCDFCSRRFSKQSSLTVHMLTHQTHHLHDCNMCGATYRRKSDLVEHMKIHSYPPLKTEDDELEGICIVEEKKPSKVRKKKKKNNNLNSTQTISTSDIDFLNSLTTDIKEEIMDESSFDDDKKFPIIDPSRPYVCQFCGTGFAREKALISHKLVHASDSTFECDQCSEIFTTEANLLQHNSTRHGRTNKKAGTTCSSRKVKEESTGETYTCQMCCIVFNSVEEILQHKENHDLATGVDTCSLCHKDFFELDDLRAHIKEAHTSNACSFCEQVFKDRITLTTHLLTHSSSRSKPPLSCNLCSRKFSNKIALKRHAATHENKEKSTTSIVCTECGASNFADGRTLLCHRQVEHGVNMARLFPCVECGKTFNSRSSQQIHIRIHTGERPYGCRYCWKAFGDGGTLRKHERIHTGEKPYVCPVCSKAFNQRVVLREHVRAHHSGTEGKVADNCYECMVCGQYFVSSDELCAHLVHHSDENTAKHRLPSVRKGTFSRKKKNTTISLPSPPIEPMSPPPPPPPLPRVEYIPTVVKKKSSKSSSSSDNLDTIVKLGKSTLENLNSIAEGKRARIVRSGKKGFHKGQNKRYLNKKDNTKNSKLMNNGSYASKYAVSQPGMESSGFVTLKRKIKIEHEDPTADDFDVDSTAISSMTDDYFTDYSATNGMDMSDSCVRTRPRTKNVSYHNMRTDHKTYSLATFDETVDEEIDELTSSEFLRPPPHPRSPKKKKSCKKKKKATKTTKTEIAPSSMDMVDPFDNQYINGITIDDTVVARETEEMIETSIVSDDLEIKDDDGSNECQICSEIFLTPDDLIRHIHSHF